ncbi:MAG: GH36-type glycosyl hydrolase domain-containing protein [Pseudobdellovibrionaceae bacterium]
MKNSNLSLKDIAERPIRAEIYSSEKLEEYAVYLAENLAVEGKPRKKTSLLKRMHESGDKLLLYYRTLSHAIGQREEISPAAEWLADNFHIVEDQLREIRNDLPKSYYNELPKLTVGDLSGYPRIYAIALALIAHTDSRLDVSTIRKFVKAFQTKSYLSVGELWAIAITLRLALVENIRRVTSRVIWDRQKKQEADELADKIIEAAQKGETYFNKKLNKVREHGGRTAEEHYAFISQLAKRLRDQEAEIWAANQCLEECLIEQQYTIEQIVSLEHQHQAADQVTIANIITSMRLLSNLNWQSFFESVSLVDRILETDPSGDYAKMDFATRDHYRHKIERLSKGTRASELDIAKKVISLAEEQAQSNVLDRRKSHVGYFLYDDGTAELEKYYRYRLQFKERLIRIFRTYPAFFYLGLLVTFVTLICGVPLYYAASYVVSLWSLLFILFLIFIPCSDLAVSFLNFILSNSFRPRTLFKMSLAGGIPESRRTLVVIPCLLFDKKTIQDLLEKLEVHYLGNTDPQLFFALLTDYVDAQTEFSKKDEELLSYALDGISRLNGKYNNEQRFALFHRRRLWNETEKIWMGWERKRGKIHELNRLLRGASGTSFDVVTMSTDYLPLFKYVITLDADTQLTRDSAKKLIGTIAHPLNTPFVDPKKGLVTKGYGIIQPRISISLESSSRSIFAQIFSGYTGIDPYTTAVSDIYQDLFGDGNYTGKGLYDIDAFEESLKDRVPENKILSHDLFEGLFARAALATDIELLDDYPTNYFSFFYRQHRWTRGDWQIAPWIFPVVPQANGKLVKNSLPLISRWKIYDNLRRSLVAPAIFLLFILSWFVLPGSLLFWDVLGFVVLSFPIFSHVANSILLSPRGISWTSNFWSSFGKAKINLAQVGLSTIFLGHQAYIQLDAISRVLYRMFISKKYHLEWITAAQQEKDHEKKEKMVRKGFLYTEVFLGLVFILLLVQNRVLSLAIGLPLLVIWSSYPYVARLTAHRFPKSVRELTDEDNQLFKNISRRVWLFFETFVGPEDNWLPPDNYQEDPEPKVAQRTSPTNIGLYGLAILSAKDFGYLSSRVCIDRLGLLFSTLKKMEHFEGHLYNWYDTATLAPLYPKYISLVDSGNYAGYLLVIKQACIEIQKEPYVSKKFLEGILTTVNIVGDELHQLVGGRYSTSSITIQHLILHIQESKKILSGSEPVNLFEWHILLRFIRQSLDDVRDSLTALEFEHGVRPYEKIKRWVDAVCTQVRDLQVDISQFAPYISNSKFSREYFANVTDESTSHLWNELYQILGDRAAPVDIYKNVSQGLEIVKFLKDKEVKSLSGRLGTSPQGNESALLQDLETLERDLNEASHNAKIFIDFAKGISESCEDMFNKINFRFLLDQERHVFYIGYNVADSRYDNSYYDLLASEARLASFVAIAKGEISQRHWFQMGRQLVPSEGKRALISWSASMFEYLMPHLVMKNFENTLLSETLHAVVRRQIMYGKKLGVPWGVSEAGYNARDLNFNYQYGPFGIPGMGLKRGLGHDLVISPYSSFLAALQDSASAIKNVRALIKQDLLTDFGFYESVDYTPERLEEKNKYAIIKSFMAHHQGMILVAIDNVLNHFIMQERFHSELRVRAAQLLLQERIPNKVPLQPPKAAELEWSGAGDTLSKSFTRVYEKTHHYSPRVQLLSNGSYSLVLSTAGSGFSKCENLAMTRWREDACRDNWGSYIYVKDVVSEKTWSVTYQPTVKIPDSYKVAFAEDKAEFWRDDGQITTHTQVIVAPEDNVELRQVTIKNRSNKLRIFEITSYVEPVLAPANEDASHPAFSKLFLQTEYLSSKNCLIARRRPRSEKSTEVWGFHCVVSDVKFLSEIQYETDRARFIGRGRDLNNPIALSSGAILSNTVGSTLDPIFSLRVRVALPPGKSCKVTFTKGLTHSREDVLQLADRYHDVSAFERESKLAWTKARIDLRHLGLDSEEAYLYQRLAERIIFSDPTLRLPSYQLMSCIRPQESLWPYGISGDVPIVATVAREKKDVNLIRKLLRCHEYLRMKGVAFDLVILNDSRTSYIQELQEDLLRQVRFSGSQNLLNKPAGVFVLLLDNMPLSDRNLIQAMAKVLISSEWGSFKEQINRKIVLERNISVFTPSSLTKVPYKNIPLNIPKVDHFNGIGGFSKEGHEYIIILQRGQWTPAPWINVIANNKDFGFQVSEAGSGFTWCKNSRENRLTPWSNDAVCDTPGEIVYLRDEDTGEVWTPTPLPIRDETVYIIRHGQGYTVFEHSSHEITQTLKQYVATDESIKISHLRLKNDSNRKRRISVTAYVEWVLGNQREKSAPYILTDTHIDMETGLEILYAKNDFSSEFPNLISFIDISGDTRTYTCDRKEFLGRNGHYAYPAALRREGLAKRKGIGLDPCTALQSVFEIEGHQSCDIYILLGQASDIDQMQSLVTKYREPKNCETAFIEMQKSWDQILNTVQIKTPENILNIMLNKWLLYQSIVCRFWARSAFYQSGGAYGFRDQLQDCMAFMYSMPEVAREHILRAASRQFVEGDVQHWWHPPNGKGVRTHFSDDLLWLPFVVSHYIKISGDKNILNEVIPFLTAPILPHDQEDAYITPEESKEKATLLDHCLRAIDRSLPLGDHGLPLIGSGDWNDGMNRIGEKGKGESVWLGWFLYKVLEDFIPCCENDPARVETYRQHMRKLLDAIEKNGWDGRWYRRAFFDDGTPLGSSINDECKIDSLSQSWSVLSKAGDSVRQKEAMSMVLQNLVHTDKNLVLLLTPPFDKTTLNPGYIKGYVPGVRENGGQYVHAALWVVMAFAELGDGNKALELLNMLNPIYLSKNRAGTQKYKIEPYVVAADIYAVEPHGGRGGWSWYTGSASWFYRVGLESVLGLIKEGDVIKFNPCIPHSWQSFEVTYKFKTTTYKFTVQNPHRICRGRIVMSRENETVLFNEIHLKDDGQIHKIKVLLEKESENKSHRLESSLSSTL